jgi:hypothetical protein
MNSLPQACVNQKLFAASLMHWTSHDVKHIKSRTNRAADNIMCRRAQPKDVVRGRSRS